MTSRNYTSLVVIIEELVKSQVYDNYPAQWDENHITRSLFNSFQANLNDLLITGFKKNLIIKWDAFKNKGTQQQNFCNAAIIVKISHKDQPSIEGAAIVETRKRTPNTVTFDDLKWKQLGKVYRNSPFSQLVLYDYADISSFSSNVILRMPPFGYGSLRERILVSPYTYAAVTSANIATHRKANDSSLYRFSLPFSHQLVMRYVHGFELDFSNKAVSIAKGDANPLGFPKTLLCINVSEENAADERQIEINKNLWEQMR